MEQIVTVGIPADLKRRDRGFDTWEPEASETPGSSC